MPLMYLLHTEYQNLAGPHNFNGLFEDKNLALTLRLKLGLHQGQGRGQGVSRDGQG